MLRRVVLGIVLLAVSACGSSSDDALSKDEFIEQGDALCQAFLTASESFPEPTDLEGLVQLLDQALPLADDTLDDLEALDPPDDGKDVHAALVSALEDSTAKIREAREAAADGDGPTAGAALEEAVALGERSDEPAKAYGFQVCGSEAELRG